MGTTYGDWLKQQREAAGLTQQQLADMAVMTRSHIAHIETGRRIPSKEDARRLDAALNTGDVLSSFLPHKDVAVADYFESMGELEQQAVLIRGFALAYFPGILQTERYAKTLFNSAFPLASEEERDKRLVTRLGRGKILNDPATPVVWTLLDETVLRRPVGGPGVMAEQITHIVRLTEAGRIRTHVMPFSAGPHPLAESMLTLMSFEDQPSLGYSEGFGMGTVHDSPSKVRHLENRYALALSDALPRKESLTFLKDIAKEYENNE